VTNKRRRIKPERSTVPTFFFHRCFPPRAAPSFPSSSLYPRGFGRSHNEIFHLFRRFGRRALGGRGLCPAHRKHTVRQSSFLSPIFPNQLLFLLPLPPHSSDRMWSNALLFRFPFRADLVRVPSFASRNRRTHFFSLV
jgi:hypothetical protein